MSLRASACSAAADTPASAATDLAHVLLDSGWKLVGARVRVIHTACLEHGTGLVASVSSEAGQVRLDLESAPRSVPGAYRPAWRATANNALPAPLLAAVSAANDAATNLDETTIGELLTAAGWRYGASDYWTGPATGMDVYRAFEDLEDDGPLLWRIRRPDLSAEIHADDDTPSAVIAALALTPATTV